MTFTRRQFLWEAGKDASLAAILPTLAFSTQSASGAITADDQAGTLTVGVALVDITCEPGPEMAGFAARVQPSTNVRTHLFARALYLAKDGETMLWLVADSLGYSQEIVARIKTELSRQLSIEPWRIVVAATHTHSAPVASRLSTTSEYSDEYVETILVPGLLKAARNARQSAEPCRMVEVTGDVDLSMDRRGKATKHTEKRVPAIGFQHGDGTFKAVLIGYTMHPVCYMSGDIAAEWPGAVADAVHEIFSPATEPFVLQGCLRQHQSYEKEYVRRRNAGSRADNHAIRCRTTQNSRAD